MNRAGVRVVLAAALLAWTDAVHGGTLNREVDGLRVELTSHPLRPGARGETEYVVRLADRVGQPVAAAHVTLRGHMADGMSVVVPLRAAKQAGVYRGRLLFMMGGTWELTLRVTHGDTRIELPLTERVGR